MLARVVLTAFGQGAYLLWALIGYRGVRLIFHREERRPWRYVLVDALVLIAACAFMTSFGLIFVGKNPGGHAGKFSAQFFERMFGRGGGLFISVTALGGRPHVAFGTRPGELAHWIWRASSATGRNGDRRCRLKKRRPKSPARKRRCRKW